MSQRIDMDRVGAVASFACAIHCAAIPILIGLSAGGALTWAGHAASWLDNEPVEWGLVILAAVVGTVSAWRGYRKHGNLTVAIVLAMAALSLLLLTAIGHDHSHAGHAHSHEGEYKWFFPVLGVVIAISHVVNRRLCKSCDSCGSHEHAPGAAPPTGTHVAPASAAE
jgi:uncharacterized membrane protein YfcA